jgi:hypothetical protein
VSIVPDGVEAQADWETLGSPETYTGWAQGARFASPGGAVLDTSRSYAEPGSLQLNHWALAGEWTIGERACVLDGAGGTIAFRFHARDVNLVLSPRTRAESVPFEVRVDGAPPGAAHGVDVDEQGNGTVTQQRLYQLVREPGPIRDRTFEIRFEAPGVGAYVFTFG